MSRRMALAPPSAMHMTATPKSTLGIHGTQRVFRYLGKPCSFVADVRAITAFTVRVLALPYASMASGPDILRSLCPNRH
jgi:hypothetical protein